MSPQNLTQYAGDVPNKLPNQEKKAMINIAKASYCQGIMYLCQGELVPSGSVEGFSFTNWTSQPSYFAGWSAIPAFTMLHASPGRDEQR